MSKKLQVLSGIFNSKKYYFLVLTLTILLGIYKKYVHCLKPAYINQNYMTFHKKSLILATLHLY